MAGLTESTPEPMLNSETCMATGVSEFGSDAALAKLREGVLYLLRRELRDFALADDLCNETFRIVLERLRQRPLDDPDRLGSFLAQTARNLAMANRRTLARQRTSTGQQAMLEERGTSALDPAVLLEAQLRAAAVRKVLLEIPLPRDRDVLVRVYLYDQDPEKVCRELGIESSHYKRVIYRARKRFRILLDQQYRRTDLAPPGNN